MSLGIRALAALAVGVFSAVPVTVATAAQERVLEVATRGPRFLLASSAEAKGRPKVIRPETMPVMRRRIAVALDRVSLEQALVAIAEQGGFPLVYSRSLLDLDAPVQLRAADISVAGALTVVLLDTGIDVLLRPNGQVVLIRRDGAPGWAAGTIKGRVTDAMTKQPVRGADVSLKGTTLRTVSGDSGAYTLTFDSLAAGEYLVQVRMLGYRPATASVTLAEGKDTVAELDVALRPLAARLDEIVTTATGRQRRRELGNAITTIHADSVLKSAPIRNLTDLLENRVPGLSVQHTSGAPGDPARLRLRGIGSVMRGNDPVVIVDGVRIYSIQSDPRSGNLTNLSSLEVVNGSGANVPLATGAPAPSPLDQIDPNIIDKVEVFKGPSAATLYGPDAANGVIVITTKRGKPGPTRWEATVTRGRTVQPGRYPVGYFRWGHVPVNGGRTEFCTLTYLRCVADSLVRYQALNDPDMTIFGTGDRTALSLTASGGSQALTYRLTGSYGDETGLLRLPDFEAERFLTRFNREPPDWMQRPHQLKTWSVASSVTAQLGRTADVTLSTNLSRSEQRRTSLEDNQTRLAGTYVDKVSGKYYVPLVSVANNPGDNIYTLSDQSTGAAYSYYQRTTASSLDFTTGLNANWRPRTWLTVTGQAGLDVTPRDDETFLPPGLVMPNDSGALARGTGRSLVSTFDLRGTLRRPLKWGFVFETSAGANLRTETTADLVSSALGLVPGTSSLSGANRFAAYDQRLRSSVFGWYVEPRLVGQRLSLSTGIRLDGGSTYGTRVTNLLGLPKLNGSWVISEEPWFPFQSLFTSLRLRGAYGQAQVQPGAMDRLRLYGRRVDGSGELLDLTTVGNSELRPERSTEIEGGFDADLLDSRISVELALYRKMQVDALMPVSLPSSVNGGGSVIRNIGNIRNTGVEVTTRLTPVRSPLLTWSAELNFQRNNNALTKLGAGVEPNPREGFVAGYPVGGRWSRPIIGFADRNRDGVVDAGEVQIGDSLVFMGRILPAHQMSVFSNLAFFGGALGVTAGFSYDGGATQIDQTAKTNWVLSRALADPTAPLAEQAAVVVYDSTTYGLTQTVSTFRFKSLSVNYRAPERVARLLRARQLTVALQGDNLAMHSTYRGKDPDVTAWSPTERVVDTGQIAVPRTWQLSFYFAY